MMKIIYQEYNEKSSTNTIYFLKKSIRKFLSYFIDPILNLELQPNEFINKIENEMIIYFEKNLIKLVFKNLKIFIKKFLINVKKY